MTARSDSPQVVGIFTEWHQAEQAIRDLKAAGFTEDQIGVAMRDRDEQQDLIEGSGSQAAEGAAKGAVSGGIVGGLVGLLGSLLIPGLGPIVVGGVLASTLAGAGIGAATGGLVGALIGLGVPEEDARHFERGIKGGGTLVTVDAGARTVEALDILNHHGLDLGPSGGRRFEVTAISVETPVGAGERAASGRRAYQGRERRVRRDASYAGPERRLVGV